MSVPGENAKFVAGNVRLSIRHGSELHRLGTCLCVRIPSREQHDTCRGLWKGADDLYTAFPNVFNVYNLVSMIFIIKPISLG